MKRRLYYLDNLRIFLSILVVLHHVGVGYGTMGGWCYVTPDKMGGTTQILLSALFGIEALFSMSLFFFISAFLTTHSLEKKGTSKFLKTQVKRLIIPLLFVMIIFAPSILFFIEKYNGTTQLSWLKYVIRQNINSPNTSHTWFILVLFVFELGYVAYWQFLRPKVCFSRIVSDKLPSHIQIALFILLCSFLTLFSRQLYPLGQNFIGLQFANFVPYIFIYSLGILVSRKGWIDQLSIKIFRSWFFLSLLFAAIFVWIIFVIIKHPASINNYIDGLYWEAVLLALIESVVCIGFCGFFIQLFKKYFDFTNGVLFKMTENRYGVYIFHSAVVVGVTVLLEFVSLSPIAKFFLACAASVLFSYLLVGAIRRFRFVRKFI